MRLCAGGACCCLQRRLLLGLRPAVQAPLIWGAAHKFVQCLVPCPCEAQAGVSKCTLLGGHLACCRACSGCCSRSGVVEAGGGFLTCLGCSTIACSRGLYCCLTRCSSLPGAACRRPLRACNCLRRPCTSCQYSGLAGRKLCRRALPHFCHMARPACLIPEAVALCHFKQSKLPPQCSLF